MYNKSLKYKWDNKNVRDYEVSKGREDGEHKKAVEMAIKLKTKNMLADEIAELTGLSIKEIEALV